MYRVAASVLIVLAVLAAWYVTQEESAPTPTSHHDDGININPGDMK